MQRRQESRSIKFQNFPGFLSLDCSQPKGLSRKYVNPQMDIRKQKDICEGQEAAIYARHAMEQEICIYFKIFWASGAHIAHRELTKRSGLCRVLGSGMLLRFLFFFFSSPTVAAVDHASLISAFSGTCSIRRVSEVLRLECQTNVQKLQTKREVRLRRGKRK